MDKYHKVLNYLLDEIDYLEVQMHEAVHEQDYELAHLLQEAFYLKQGELMQFGGIFEPVNFSVVPFRFPDKFIVNTKAEGRALPYILGDLVKAKIKGIHVVFEKDVSKQGGKDIVKLTTISISESSEGDILLVLQQYLSASDGIFGYEDFQIAYLHQIGWRTESPEKQKFSLSISKYNEAYQEQTMQILARTYYSLRTLYEEVNCFVHIKT